MRNEDVVAAEQSRVDETIEELRHLLDERPSATVGAGDGDAHAARALARMRAEQDAALNRALDRPFFGVVRDDAGREIRLGPASIWSRDNRLLVSNWRADASEPFYIATAADRRGQRVRLRVQIRERVVVAVEHERLDETDAPDSSRAAAIEAAASPNTGRMSEIVGTIQPDQYGIIATPPSGVLGVQGGPGTGKSAVALHRAAWLLYRYQDIRSGGVLFVGPGRLFLDFVSDVLPALGEDAVDQVAANRVMLRPVLRSDSDSGARLKGDFRMAELLRRAVDLRIARHEPEAITFTVGATRVEIPAADVAAALRLARAKREPAMGQRNHFIRELVNRARPVPGRIRMIVTGLEEAALQNADFRRAVARLWPSLSAKQLVFDLLTSRRRLRAAGRGLFTPQELDALHVKDAPSLDAMRFTEADVPVLDEARSLLTGVPTIYAHVIVDEAQDLSPMQLRCVARRARSGSMTLLGDIAQRKSVWTYATWAELFEAVGQPGVLRELTMSYRIPSEILALASGLLRRIAPGLQMPQGLRTAAEPMLVGALPPEKLELGLRGVLERFSREAGSVAVLCPEQFLAEALAAARETAPEASRDNLMARVVVLTPSEAAGLEFDSVIVLHPDRIALDVPAGTSQLFVAMTRAVQRLAVIGNTIPREVRHAAVGLGRACSQEIPIGARRLAPPKSRSQPERRKARSHKPPHGVKPRSTRIDWTKASGKGELGEDYKGWWTGG